MLLEDQWLLVGLMGGKARVHELAKELGVTSKELLAKLREQGEFVKSASSTVERASADRLRAHFGNRPPSGHQRRQSDDQQSPGSGRRGQRTVLITPPHKINPPAPPPQFTESQLADLRRDYRQAYAAKDFGPAITEVLTKYQQLYRVSRSALRDALTEDKRRNVAVYTGLRLSRNPEKPARSRRTVPQSVPAKRRDETPRAHPPQPQAPTRDPRPRTRSAGLPPARADIHKVAIADIVVKADTARDIEKIAIDLVPFDPDDSADYGFLAWRYATTHQHPAQPPARSAGDELASVARVVDNAKHRLHQLHESAGRILEHPNLVPRAIEGGFTDLFDPDDIGRTASDDRRRVMAKHAFLQRAVLLVIANPQCAERLWGMLDALQPPPQHQLFETTPLLRSAMEALTRELSAVEALLLSDETALEHFVHRSHAELTDLHNGRFDYFQQFRDAGASSATTRRVISGLPFTVLPQGVHLRTFLTDLRTTKRYHGHHLDENRLTVLEELQEHFGAHRCIWHKGSVTSNGVDNRYLVLSIASATGPDESAVAISPLAGEHATYVVRHGCADAHWARIFELTKEEARQHGARRLYFRGDADQYTDMRDKIISILEGDPHDFYKH